jgi:multiple sugar transport system permease protein
MTVLEHERTATAVGRRPERRPTARRFFAKTPIFFVLPAVVLLLAFAAYPLIVLVRMSLSDVGPSNIIGVWNFVGLQNFAQVLATSEVWASALRTVEVSVVLLASNLILGFLAASILSVSGRVTNVVLGIMVFVWALPPIVSGSVWKFLLDDSGAVNSVLALVGIPDISWLSNPSIAIWVVAGVIAWASLPFSALILRGGMLAISQDIIEAAAIDGAGYWRTRFQIVLPLLRPTMWILAILTILYAFKSFDFFYVLTQGGPGTSTNTLPVQSYYTAFTNFDMSTGATIAVISMLFVAIFAIPYVRSVRNEAAE